MSLRSGALLTNNNTCTVISETALTTTLKRITRERRSLLGKFFTTPDAAWRDGYLDGWNNGGEWDQSWNEAWSNS